MLDHKYRFDNEGYKLVLKEDDGWATSKNRVLIVVQYVPSYDLKNRELLSTKESKECLTNIINLAQKWCTRYSERHRDFKYKVFNFYSEKHFHLNTQERHKKELEFGERLTQAIKKYKPTHVLFCGNTCYSTVTNNPYSLYRLGWTEKLKVGSTEFIGTQTFDLFWLLGDATGETTSRGQHSNSLGVVALHLSYLLNGSNPFNLSHVKPSPKYIESKKDFDSLMDLMAQAKYVGLDTETKNLTVTQNTIYTIQFAPNNSQHGYVLALNHPRTPWNEKQIAYFKKKLKQFFVAQDGPTLVTMNGKFDLRVIRRYLKIPVIARPVWEITAGEHLLNEDMVTWSVLELNKAHYGGLRAILATYMNDFYFKNEFTKEDRDTTGDLDPDDPAFLRYAAMDVQCLLPIMNMQVKRASYQDIKGKSYKPFFVRHMLYEMSDTVHVLSHLDEDGSYIDMKYMNKLASSTDSPFIAQLDDIKEQINSFDETKEANAQLLKDKGFKSKGLFGGQSNNNWVFNLGKADHKVKLFLDVLGLKSVETTTKGEPSIGKAFVKAYKDTNQIVELYGQYQEVNKIYNSYIKSWARLLNTDLDGQYDNHLRPSYGFWGVATGRISSQNPSLQVIPQHGPSANAIKRAFIAPKGKLLVHYDYSAHEVRGWAITAGDDVLADAFRQGQKLRQQWIADPSDEVKEQMKTKGDIHIQNAHRFFNRWVTKKDPLRQAVKAVIFGVLYQKSAKTLGEDTKTGDLQQLSSRLSETYHKLLNCSDKEKAKLQKEVKILEQKVAALKAEDRTEYAQHIMDKLFSTFKNGAKWTHDMKASAEKLGYVYSPIGRIRHLWSTILVNKENKKLINQQIRRGSNAPIQGFASELAVKSSRLVMTTFYAELPKICEMLGLEGSLWSYKLELSRMVHDASYYAVPYELVIPFIHISQYCATYGVARQVEQQFGLRFNIEPEIEYELATCDSQGGGTWDWSIPNLLTIIKSALQDAHDRGELDDVEQAYATILRAWKNKQCRNYLCDKYPLLNVQRLQPVIIKAIKNEQNNDQQ